VAGRQRGHPGPVDQARLAGRNRPRGGDRLPAVVPLPGRYPFHSAHPHPFLDRHLEAAHDEQEDGAGDSVDEKRYLRAGGGFSETFLNCRHFPLCRTAALDNTQVIFFHIPANRSDLQEICNMMPGGFSPAHTSA